MPQGILSVAGEQGKETSDSLPSACLLAAAHRHAPNTPRDPDLERRKLGCHYSFYKRIHHRSPLNGEVPWCLAASVFSSLTTLTERLGRQRVKITV